jgi:Fur family ferric uptake transcriptional regulator
MAGVSRSQVASDRPPPHVDSVEDVMALVRARGGRVTTARRLLARVLFEQGDHLSAERLAVEVQEISPDVHVSTIYRNLDELERLGVVTHTHLGHGPATYHLAARRHGHLVCERCGETAEIPLSLFDSLRRHALSTHGFTVDPGHSAVMGLCGRCRGASEGVGPRWSDLS